MKRGVKVVCGNQSDTALMVGQQFGSSVALFYINRASGRFNAACTLLEEKGRLSPFFFTF